MAKRSSMTPAKIELFDEVGREIVEALKGVALEVEGAPTTSVKYKDGSFKRRAIMGGWNFFVEYAYLGARGDLIFGLTPEDDQEYETAEWLAKNMDEVFPLAGTELSKKIGIKGESFKALCDLVVARAADEKTHAASREKEAYAENPLFGMF